jgi:hypothetical protein
MRRLAAVLLVLAAGSAEATPPGEGSAETIDDEPTELEPTSARATRAGDVVRIAARFDLDAVGPIAPPGDARTFSLPSRSVITGATALAGGQSHRLQLLKRADADKKVEALGEPPAINGGRISAIRIDATDSSATLDIAVPRRTAIRLDVAIEARACYANDARHFKVPASWSERVSGATRIDGVALETIHEQCDDDGGDGAWFAIPANELAKQPSGEARIGFTSARVKLGTKDVARMEIALAKQLSDIPRDLHTVFVVDHSRSLTALQLEVQRAAIAGYLRAAPRARVQLVGYTRDARTRLAGWMLASRAGTRIERELLSLPPRNGSNVDAGVATAATLLANVAGTRRIVVFTDALLSKNQAEEATQAAAAVGLPPQTLLHVVQLGGFGTELVRDDANILAPLAKQTEGIAMHADIDTDGAIDAMPLVRPISLDNLSVETPGWQPLFDGPQCLDDSVLREGSACNVTGFGPPSGGAFQVTGMLWNTKVTRTITPDLRGARSLARLLSMASGLPADLLEPIQNAAVAVNSAWSLLAMWGPKGGYADQEMYGSFGFGRIGTSSIHTSSSDTGVGRFQRRVTDEIRAQLTPSVLHCKPQGVIRVIVELTKDEIVDVQIYARDKRDESLADCITTNVWETMLSLAEPPTRDTVVVDIQP